VTTSKSNEQSGRDAPRTQGGGPTNVLSPGTLIGGKFRIEERIARGGQASVYLARQEPLNRPVALKLLSPPSLEATEEERDAFEQRFLLEARTLAALDHPNIVTVFDYGETDDGRYYLAMEYISGGRFLDLLKRGHMEAGRTVNLCIQVAQALRYAHKRGVVHRDVKNSNVLVRHLDNGEEQAKVVDFGLVKLSKLDSGLTQTGMILGSPHFMAPEQATGQGVDHRADIYATGVLLYCGLTGNYPFDGPHATAIITAHVTRDVPSFASVAPDVRIPDGLEIVVRRCLEKKPGRRYPSMDALIAELLPYHTGAPLEAASGEFHTLTGMKAIQPKRDWASVWAGIVVGGVIAILVAMVVITAVLGYKMRDELLPAPEVVEAPPVVEPAPAPVEAAPEVPPPAQAAPVPAAEQPSPQPVVRPPPAPTVRRVEPRPAPEPAPEPAPPPADPAPGAGDWSDVDLEGLENPWDK
jgi:tRNA A-37 threonylcarbamoyl transferase component Bud32